MKLCVVIIFFLGLSVQHVRVVIANFFDHSEDISSKDDGSLPYISSIDNVGTWHNTIMTQIHDRLDAISPPILSDYAKIVEEEVINSLCTSSAAGSGGSGQQQQEKEDRQCRDNVLQTSNRAQNSMQKSSRSRHGGLPETFQSMMPVEFQDHEAMEDLEDIRKSVLLLEEDFPLDYVMEKLTLISERVTKDEDRTRNEEHKLLVQGTVSIAKASCEYWVVDAKDPHSPFRGAAAAAAGLSRVKPPDILNVLWVIYSDVYAFAFGFVMSSYMIITIPGAGILWTAGYAALESAMASGFAAFFFLISSDAMFCLAEVLTGNVSCFGDRWFLMSLPKLLFDFIITYLENN